MDSKGLFTVVFDCSDDCDENPTVTMATLNGIEVTNGQVIDLRVKSEKSEKSAKSKKSGKSKKSQKSGKSEKPMDRRPLIRLAGRVHRRGGEPRLGDCDARSSLEAEETTNG